MAYSEDAVRAKLASLNESQDSIVSNAQWIMFHRRHAPRTAALWLERLHTLPPQKRLTLIYLANEVVQQSRARGKPDFLLAFEPIIAEATAAAYQGASQDVQGRVRRVVEVWRQRGIFDARILESVEGRLAEIDRAKGPGKGTGGSGGGGGKMLGGSLFGGGGGHLPRELEPIAKSLAAVGKVEGAGAPTAAAAEAALVEYAKLTDAGATAPTPPVYAARLSALMKSLAAAEAAIGASVQARREVVAGVEALLEEQRARLAEDEAKVKELADKKEVVESKKRAVEDAIMRGLSGTTVEEGETTANRDFAETRGEEEGPEAEGFTPPPPDVEAFTPPPPEVQEVEVEGLPQGEDSTTAPKDEVTMGTSQTEPPMGLEQQAAPSQQPAVSNITSDSHSLKPPTPQDRVRQASTELPAPSSTRTDPRLKRRKTSHPAKTSAEEADAEVFAAGGGVANGIDEEGVAAMFQ
ncbi:hypothetical protein M433DRAFT_153755 [Acidomyces richmondensis BFW]|nr:MAG: hypothetical protein FE78DRAFT_89601 [Acidomyces sp. 'richmondensis']KYG46138.1 hypothetical protein M433DRAFT_153755 [Acidomyces richmondensis BFW]